jgi:hypothetical protein
MSKIRHCQCGAKPVHRVERDDIRDKRRRRIRERLMCPACGNATAPHSSRRALREEWEHSGWCGMGEILGLAQRGPMPMEQICAALEKYNPPCLLPKCETQLWGQPRTVRPALVAKVFGNGKRVIRLMPLHTRPNYYLVRIDDRWDMNNDGDDMCLRDHLDEILDEIGEEFGERDEDETGCPLKRWPELKEEPGVYWDIAQESDLPPYGRRARSGEAAWKLVAWIGAAFAAAVLVLTSPSALLIVFYVALVTYYCIKIGEIDQ